MDEGERRFLSAKLGGCKKGNTEWDSGLMDEDKKGVY